MGVRIVYDNLDALRDHHHGVSTTTFVDRDARYEPNALVPNPERTQVDLAVLERLRATEDTPDTALIELVRPPHRLVTRARNLTADRIAGEPVHVPINAPDVGGGAYDVTLLGGTASPTDALTTTVNPRTGLRHGIHPDNWDALPRAERLTQSRRRLAINLGPGPRYLLIAFPDVIDISRALRPTDDQHVPRTADVREYARQHPDALTVHWLRIDPGEGYLAPTELIAHDGSTHNINQPSDTAFYLGRWPRRFFPSLLS
jgi:hypothetical protein